MKRSFPFLIIFTLGIILGFAYKAGRAVLAKRNRYTQMNIVPASKTAKEQKRFAVIVPSYNNLNYYEKNLFSILEQDYEKFRVIYIDDASTDGTSEAVPKFLKKYDLKGRVEYRHNEINCGAMENLYRAIHGCDEDEIIVIVDGDDSLAHHGVLREHNEIYSNPDVWLTYGDYFEVPYFEKGRNRPILKKYLVEKRMRRRAFVTSHLRTFYAGLFKQVQLKDLLYEGKFLPISYDIGIMIPMLELATTHVYFNPSISYLYEIENPLCDYKKGALQEKVELSLRSHSVYPESSKRYNSTACDLIVFSYDRPLQLYAFLESAMHYISHYDQIHVLYRASEERFEKGYLEVKKAFDSMSFVRQSNENPKENFKVHLMEMLLDPKVSKAPYIAFAVDDIIVKDEIDLKACVSAMQAHHAYGFYLRLGKHVDYCYNLKLQQGIPDSIAFDGGINAWQFANKLGDWCYPNSVDMTVFEKKRIKNDLASIKFSNPNQLEQYWAERADLNEVGLYFDHSKIINIPFNIVSSYVWKNREMEGYDVMELLEQFEAGLKIDFSSLYKIENHSAHMEWEPLFIER